MVRLFSTTVESGRLRQAPGDLFEQAAQTPGASQVRGNGSRVGPQGLARLRQAPIRNRPHAGLEQPVLNDHRQKTGKDLDGLTGRLGTRHCRHLSS